MTVRQRGIRGDAPERRREDGPPGLGRDARQVSIHQYGRIRGDAQPCTRRHFHPPTSANHGGNLAGAHKGGRAPTRGAPTLGNVVGAFKSVTTVEYGRGVRELGWQRFDKRLWQRNNFERVIRNDSELGRVREYIANNIMKWEFDRENPSGTIASSGRSVHQ